MDLPVTASDFLEIIRTHGLEYFGRYYGKYRGLIVDNKDPELLGRVKLRVPQVAGDNIMQYWAHPSGQPAGDDFGDFMIPPEGSPVWVTFENGDPSFPVYEGGHWGKSASGVPSGSTGNPRKRIKSSEKWRMEMDDENDELFIQSKSGGHEIRIKGNGDIEVTGGGDLTETIGGNASKTVTGNKSVACVNFGLNATGNSTMNIGGVTISFDGAGTLSVSSGGSTLEINPSGVVIMGKDFLPHTHNGVDAGADISGGVT